MSAAYDNILVRDGAARARRFVILALTMVVVLAAMWLTGLLDPARFVDAWPAVRQLSSEMFPPDFSRLNRWAWPLVDTLAMSISGTAIAVALSLPIALLAARNTTPHRVAYQASRLLLNLLRSVPELIMGIILVAMVGFGALPGALALGLHSVGMVGKFFAESIEHVDQKPVEAARAAGATTPQVIWHAVLPQAMPQLADITIYRWEYNFRASTVLGAVGAGGIGFELIAALRVLEYAQVSAILICILVCVTIVDGLGAALRRSLK
jgi:phosphonate transport system permease protein